MSLFRHIKSLFVTDAIEHPFVIKTATTKTNEVLPDNLTYIKGQAYVQTNRRDGFEADIWKGQAGQKTDRITQSDRDMIETRGLKETKYVELKVFWAADYSIAQVVREMRSRKGYGQRTIEKYWSAMNAANQDTPLSNTGGGVPQQ